MVAIPATIPPPILAEDKRKSLHYKAVQLVKEAQDIYFVPSSEIQKAAITANIKRYLFSELPNIFNDMANEIDNEIRKNEPFDLASYQEMRLLYDSVKPVFDAIGDIKIPSNIKEEKELVLYKSAVKFLYAAKRHIAYLDCKFLDLDKPKFESRTLSHIPESKLWAMRNQNRPYLV